MRSVTVIADGMRFTYPSITATAKALGMHRHSIENRVRDGVLEGGRLVGSKPVEAENVRMGFLMRYPSTKEAARCLGVSVDTMRKRLRDGAWLKTDGIAVKVRYA